MENKNEPLSQENDIVEGEFEEISFIEVAPETDIIVHPSQAIILYEDLRLGCTHCFRTLNPLDEEETLRNAVRVGKHYYHASCWERAKQPEQTAEAFMPPVPKEIPIVELRGSPLYTGVLNTMEDHPLGISESNVVLDTTRPVTFRLRNNGDIPAVLDRRVMPFWAYVDFGTLDKDNQLQQTVLPQENFQLTVYPHVIRPAMETYHLTFNSKQGVNLESRTIGIIPVANLVGVYGLYLWYISTMLNIRYWLYYWDSLSGVSFVTLTLSFVILAALFASMALTAPAVVLWQLHNVMTWLDQSRAKDILPSIRRDVKTFILNQFRNGSVAQSMSTWTNSLSPVLVAIGIGGALVLWLPFLILKTIFVASLSDFFFLGELGIVLFIIYHFGMGYGFNLLSAVETVIRFGMATYRDMNASAK